MTSPRRAAMYGTPPAADTAGPEWRQFGPRDDHWADPADPPDLVRPRRHRRWEAARAEWGRRNGFDPDAKYTAAEGHRWWEFCDSSEGTGL